MSHSYLKYWRVSMLKTASWLVAACGCVAFIATPIAAPALAADMPATQAKPATPAMAMAMKPRHLWSCYDYAWESQAMKDCLAKPAAMPMAKPMHHPMRHMVHHMAPKPVGKPMVAPPTTPKS
jgi:hypothetical protein